MVLLVPAQRARVTVRLLTALDETGEGLRAPVGQQVAVQVILPLEGLAARRTLVAPLLAVRQPVLGQRRRVAERLGTGAAHLRGTGLDGTLLRGRGIRTAASPLNSSFSLG